jgi:hypothetical protein
MNCRRCRDLLVYCSSGRCHHSATLNADWLLDETPVRSLCPRTVCTRCGLIGVANLLQVIEQITYLIFIKRLDEMQELRQLRPTALTDSCIASSLVGSVFVGRRKLLYLQSSAVASFAPSALSSIRSKAHMNTSASCRRYRMRSKLAMPSSPHGTASPSIMQDRGRRCPSAWTMSGKR